MTCESDLFLPGTVRESDDGFALEHETGTVPVRDPDGHLTAADVDEPRTLGLAVSPEEVHATDEPVGVSTADGTVRLVGRKTVQRVRFGQRNPGPFLRIGFGPGVWPGESSILWGDGPMYAGPLSACEATRPDRVRIETTELRVQAVLADDRNPYAGRLSDLRIEFDPDGDAVRVTVPGVPLWTTSGWHQKDPEEFLAAIGARLRDLVDGEEESSTGGAEGLRPKITADGDRIRFEWHWVEHRLGCWPEDGLVFDRDTFVRAWLRDAELYDAWFDADRIGELVTELRERTGLKPAATRAVLREPASFDTAALEALVRTDADRRRDAARALWRRGDGAPALVDALHDDGSRPADERVLVGALDADGGRESLEGLVRYVRTAPDSRIRGRAADCLDVHARTTLATAIYDNARGDPQRVAKDLRRRTRREPDTPVPDFDAVGADDPALCFASGLADAVDDAVAVLGDIEKRHYNPVCSGQASLWAVVDDSATPDGARVVAAALTTPEAGAVDGPAADKPAVSDSTRDALLAVLRTDGDARIRALAASTLASIYGEAVVEALLDALVEDEHVAVRNRIAVAIERADPSVAERADAATIADHEGGPAARRDLLETSRYGTLPDIDAVREGLRSGDPTVWTVAARSAPAFWADPPYDELLALLDRVEPKEGHDPPINEWQSALDSLADLVKNGRAPLPSAGPLLNLLEKPYRARTVALDALAAIAEAHGEFPETDPERVYRAIFRTQQSNPKTDLKKLATIVIETYDSFEPGYLAQIPCDPARRAVLRRVAEAVDEAAVPLLLAYADDDDDQMVQRVLYQLRSHPEHVPVEGLDVDLAANNRALLLYKLVALAAIDTDDTERARAFVDEVRELTRDDRWYVRAKGLAVLAYIAAFADTYWDEVVGVAAEDPSTVVRRVGLAGLGGGPLDAVEEWAVSIATDGAEPVLVREYAWSLLCDRAGELSADALDRLDGRLDTNPPLLRPVVYETLTAAGRDPPVSPGDDAGFPDLPGPDADRGTDIDDPDADLGPLRDIVRDGDDADRRVAALYRLGLCYRAADEIEVTDVIDPIEDALADANAARAVRETAALVLVLIHHRRAFDALDAAAPERIGSEADAT
ncbi:HEAT repeat domain-containing protein [Haloarcula salinisoli]|uniref:HEAT repeat n=1 Tax=Haloarcula salinisoli TaxID=2487746 RepID=A0A8J8CER0_9EURY|nr:HEAT repeat domain-containing protein [Halomicroarcula salinisoli]MBX0305980.1 hypothetical protein [Halomicroarcula salinisoli]